MSFSVQRALQTGENCPIQRPSALLSLGLFSVLHLLGPASADAEAAIQGKATVPIEREAYLMGTRLRAHVEAASRAKGVEAIEAAFGAVRGLEDLLSTWRGDTELARLNSAPPGKPVRVSRKLLSLLGELRYWTARTGGAFDPAVGPLVDAWDLRGHGRRPSESELADALAISRLDGFEIDESVGTVARLREGAWITAGGFGKGAALRAALRALTDAGIESAVLDFGGQLATLGSPSSKADWTIAVAHPSQREEPAALIRLQDGRSAATSSASERFVEIAGQRFGHIVDPRSGRPVPAWGSVTVVAEDPLAADLLSTALFVLGPKEAASWVSADEDIGVLVLLEKEGDVVSVWNAAMERWLVRQQQPAEAGT